MKTLLSIKTEKPLKLEAQRIAEEFGIPLSTLINAFLKQFVRNKEVSLDISHKPTPYLWTVILQAEKDLQEGNIAGTYSDSELINRLKKL